MKQRISSRLLKYLHLLLLALASTGCADSGGINDPGLSDANLNALADQALIDSGFVGAGFTQQTIDGSNSNTLGGVVENMALDAQDGAAGTGFITAPAVGALSVNRDAMGRAALVNTLQSVVDAIRAGAVRQATQTVNVDVTISGGAAPCVNGGSIHVIGTIVSNRNSANTEFSSNYNLTVDIDGCDDGTYEVWGELFYTGSISIADTGTVYEFSFNLGFDAGIAIAEILAANYWVFIIRESIGFDGTINRSTGAVNGTIDATRRVDDGINNVQCTVTGTIVDDVETVSVNCTVTASTL